MDKQTYTQRVQALAEKMAKATCAKMALIDGSDLTWNDAGEEEKKLFIETHIPAARIAVAEMADIFRQGWAARHNKVFGTGRTVETELKEQGLIPDKVTDTGTRTVAGNTIPAGPDNAQEGGQHG